MASARKVLIAALFAASVWASIRALDHVGRSGWAGGVVRQNLDFGIDATPLFYTELETASGSGERP